jgi:lysophospholipase L1-like esterase
LCHPIRGCTGIDKYTFIFYYPTTLTLIQLLPPENSKMHKLIAMVKTIAPGIAVTILFWVFLEAGVRVALLINTGDSGFLTYGIKRKYDTGNRFEKFFDDKGDFIYSLAVPSKADKNPVNLYGLRGLDISEKKPHTKRIICLGGSTTWGMSLDYEDSYPKILQEMLDAHPGPLRYEVINAGIPAHKLPNIIRLTEHRLLPLQPDIIILMSVFNNLVSDARDFKFIRVVGEEKNMLMRWGRKAINVCKRYSLLVESVDNIAQKGYRNHLRNIHWEQGAEAIMRSTGLWDSIAEDLRTLFSLLISNNSGVHIIVLDEPMNTIDYPELAAPMEKAYQVQREVCGAYDNVYHLELKQFFYRAQEEGAKVWVAPYYDPIHLSRAGNELISGIVARQIMALSVQAACIPGSDHN